MTLLEIYTSKLAQALEDAFNVPSRWVSLAVPFICQLLGELENDVLQRTIEDARIEMSLSASMAGVTVSTHYDPWTKKMIVGISLAGR